MDYSSALPGAGGRPPGGIGGFDAAAPAPEFSPLPPGVYLAHAERGGVHDHEGRG